ncbi:C4-dicarboxylate ABC transporter substrate-binding protein [Caballeronia novacaledonica]|uniref:C4-dicarboxylate ABC transporter substrate-binding protein n=1 Tax=Caballeronia novacaledonica TaxID=1544861 RepID=A0A2U3ICT9_9BURK|nr:TAXI family TRAP transporter solute-binding subunit [Caballeronia novacaledonica]SPB18036.1 C4-dicarboxylate ABC transporter substrate-binding protein [Caballeronia novacaledonica]
MDDSPDAPESRRGGSFGVSWPDLAVSVAVMAAAIVVVIWVAIRLIRPAPPDTLTISSGPEYSRFWFVAEKYKEILARNGVTLNVLTSTGTLDNLTRLADPAGRVDLGFVQSGLTSVSNVLSPDTRHAGLMSLGTVSNWPLFVFYRGPVLTRLSEFKGKRLAIGREGSGTRQIVLLLLKTNGVEANKNARMLPIEGEDAVNALLAGTIDAAFLRLDSARDTLMQKMIRTADIRLFDFTQAKAYTRAFPFLSQFEVPMGAFDLADNLPPESTKTIETTIELVARDTLHPALSDLIIEAAGEVHGGAGLQQDAGEFPAPVAHDFPLSPDAARYYKSGKSFVYRTMPFWLASLADRLIVLVVPIVVVLVPALRYLPPLYAWRVKSRFYRRYGELVALERGVFGDPSESNYVRFATKLDEIEKDLNRLRMPLAYADSFYALREHISYVRSQVEALRRTGDV